MTESGILLEDVRPGLALVHGTVLRLVRVTAVARRGGGAGCKALPLDPLVVQGLPIEGEHGARSDSLLEAPLAAAAGGTGRVLPLLLLRGR